MNNAPTKERATSLLRYYFSRGNTSRWDSDNDSEIADAVELIIDAASDRAIETLAEKIEILQRRLDDLEAKDLAPSMADTVQRAADAQGFA